ncbi:MAG TPA: c-type cytochrome domain-containing protein, partial [Vicinamibacterales bacterium]|nr:c-type cytochrome domain-containing protein [Vicinamibacterales bacterium]
MKRVLIAAGIISIPMMLGAGAQAPQPRTASATAQYRSLVDQYCVTCHNTRLKTGGLSLDRASLDDVPSDAEVWEKVIHKLQLGAMPPQGRPRPDAGALRGFIDALESSLDASYVAHPNPGRAPLHRLNRSEYANAVRDLL